MTVLVGTFILVMLLASAILAPAWAALGQPSVSVERDRVMMKGQRQSRTAAGYVIETITVAGMEIKEYISGEGLVFAIVWTGTGSPDLQLLLGDYFDDYRTGLIAARQRKPRVREPFKMKSARLVVERAGHSRSLWGRAYLPTRLPPGVKPEDIR
jgi:hypothetical protein